MPSPSAARKFLYEFHEEAKIEEAKQRRTAEQIAYIAEETEPLVGLGVVNRELVRELGRRCPDQRIATVDQDATIIESRKQEALRAYEGGRGAAVWLQMCGLGVLLFQFPALRFPRHPAHVPFQRAVGGQPHCPFAFFVDGWRRACPLNKGFTLGRLRCLFAKRRCLPGNGGGPARPVALSSPAIAGTLPSAPPPCRGGAARRSRESALERTRSWTGPSSISSLAIADDAPVFWRSCQPGTPVHRGWAARRVSGPGTTIATPMGKDT